MGMDGPSSSSPSTTPSTTTCSPAPALCGGFFLGQQQQVGAMEVARDDLLAVVTSRLEGSTWDGMLRLFQFQHQKQPPQQTDTTQAAQRELLPPTIPGPEQCSSSSSSSSDSLSVVVSFREAAPAVELESGSAAVAWCGSWGSDKRDVLAVAQDTGDVQVFKVVSGGGGEGLAVEAMTTLSEHDDLISALVADKQQGRVLATGSWDCGIRLWNLGSPAVSTQEFTGHTDHVTALAWEPESDTILASASKDRTVKLWDTRGNKQQQPTRGGLGSSSSGRSCYCHGAASGLAVMPLCVSWCDDSSSHVIAVGLDDGSVALYDTRNLSQEPVTKRLHAASVGAVAFAPARGRSSSGADGSSVLLASGGDDCKAVVSEVLLGGSEGARKGAPAWGTRSARRRLLAGGEHKDYVRALCWLPEVHPVTGRLILVTAGWDGHLTCHQVAGTTSAAATPASTTSPAAIVATSSE